MKHLLTGVIMSAALLQGALADTYTYTYKGPTFSSNSDHIEVVFTTSVPLKPNSSYMNPTEAGVINAAVFVVGPKGVVNGFNGLPSTGGNFELRTDGTASATSHGIDSWYIFGGSNNLQGTSPTMTGTDYQAYTMNTLKSIPGQDRGVQMVTGNYAYDQATQTTYYTSCNGVPGCSLAGNGQPYTTDYAARSTTPVSSSANWTMRVNVAQPPQTAPVTLSGTLPAGTVGQAYSGTLTATGGTKPYTWSATGLPSGLTLGTSSGQITGTPQAEGNFSVNVTVTDSAAPATTASNAQTLTVNPAATASCVRPALTLPAAGKGLITETGKDYIKVNNTVVRVPACTKISWNGPAGFKVGQKAEFEGYTSLSSGTVATRITIN